MREIILKKIYKHSWQCSLGSRLHSSTGLSCSGLETKAGDTLTDLLGKNKIFKIRPNTPCSLNGEGME
jgi:hypothetical protein